MPRIISKNEATRKKFTFSVDGKLKDEFDEARKELEELGLKVDANEDFEKVLKSITSEMRKVINSKLISHNSSETEPEKV